LDTHLQEEFSVGVRALGCVGIWHLPRLSVANNGIGRENYSLGKEELKEIIMGNHVHLPLECLQDMLLHVNIVCV
jgi:hypothetical protein